jgi:hypothetical protein
VLVVAGQPGHQLLRILGVDIDQEPGGDRAAKHAGRAAVVPEFDVSVLALAVGEPVGCSGHSDIVGSTGP